MIKNLFKRIVIFILSILLFIQFVPNKTINAAGAIGNRIVIGYNVTRMFLQTKELDLSETDIQMYVTEADKNRLYIQAKESALKWYYLTIALMNEKFFVLPGKDDPSYEELEKKACTDQINKHGLYKKYWHDNLNLDDIDLIEDARLESKDISIKDYINNIMELDDIDALIANLSTDGDYIPVLSSGDEQDNVKEEQNILIGKIEEIFNDRLSDFIVGMISSNIDTNAEFSIIPLAEDGSENKEFDIPGVAYKGELNDQESLKFNIDFSSDDQFYDPFLEESFKKTLASYVHELYPSWGYSDYEDYGFLLKDNRSIIEHIMFINNGYLSSSDYSQEAHAYSRGDERYPGYCNLVTTPIELKIFPWARYSIPSTKYVQTFNLGLNPFTFFFGTNIEQDLITHIDFDENGRITSIRKPIMIPQEILDIILQSNPKPGTYRFKLIESNTNDEGVLTDETPMYIDFDILQDYNPYTGETKLIISRYNVDELDDLSDYGELPDEIDLSDDLDLIDVQELAEYYPIQSINVVNKLAKVDVKLYKIWDDKDDEDGIRPDINEFINKIVLLVDEKESEIEPTSIEDKGNTFEITYEDLPKYRKDEGKLVEIKYDIKELEIEGYNSEKTGNAKDGFVITNKHTPEDYVDFKVYKTDLKDNALYNAKLALYDENGNQLEKWITDGNDHKLSVKPGMYTIKEIEAPIGFDVHNPIEFKIDKDGSILLKENDDVKLIDNKIIVKDSRSIKGTHHMEFDKVDTDGNLLKGATIRIYDDSGNVFDEWVSDNRTHVCPLQPNTYWFLEVEAPEGYLKIEKFGFEVDEDGYFKLIEEVKQVETTNTNMKIINKLEPRFKTPYDIPKTGIK